jgi:hypothetical protein
MSVLFAHLFLAAAQSQTKFMLQLVKTGKFQLYVGQLFLQAALHRRTWLQTIPSQSQKSADLTELESQTLHSADKGQCLYVVLCVLAKPSPGPGWPRNQTVALVKSNRINGQPNLFRDDTNLHFCTPISKLHPGV